MIKDMDMEYINIMMEEFNKVNGKMMKKKDMEWNILLIQINMNMEFIKMVIWLKEYKIFEFVIK